MSSLLSTTEGDDKPAKYPVMFRAADLVRADQDGSAPVWMISIPRAPRPRCGSLANAAPVIALSARRASGLDPWLDWLRHELRNCCAAAKSGKRTARRAMSTARQWLDGLHALKLPRPLKVMNVCGGHERSIAMAGLRKALPANIEIVPGPGCPVCVCPEEAVYQAIRLALDEGVILVAFGDMLRVPVNVPKTQARSLEQARAAGGDVRPVASPREAVRIARANPDRRVVFFAAGFETTTAPVAAMLLEGVPDNLVGAACGTAHLAGGRDAARIGGAGLRCADRAGPCRHGHGAGGMAFVPDGTGFPPRSRGSPR